MTDHASVKLLRSRLPEDRGIALVEFALVLPILMLLLFGMVDFGKAFNYWIDSTHLANTGARYAVVDYNAPGSGSLRLAQHIKSLSDTPELRDGGTDSIPSPGVRVCIAFPNGAAVGEPVKVTATTTYNLIPYIGGEIGFGSLTIAGSATMRLEALPTNYGAGCTS